MLGQVFPEIILNLLPLAAQGRDDYRLNDQKNVLFACVVRTDLRSLPRIEDALKKRAEDARLDAGPVALSDTRQNIEVLMIQRKRRCIIKQSAIEMLDFYIS